MVVYWGEQTRERVPLHGRRLRVWLDGGDDERKEGDSNGSRSHDAGNALSLVRAGETVTVARVRGNEDMKHHLGNLGFVEGSEVHVVSASGGNIIVTVKGARFGLDAKVAQHVMTV